MRALILESGFKVVAMILGSMKETVSVILLSFDLPPSNLQKMSLPRFVRPLVLHHSMI